MAKIEKSLESGPQLFVPQLFLGAPQAEKVTLSPIIPNRKSCDTSKNFPRDHTKLSKLCLRHSLDSSPLHCVVGKTTDDIGVIIGNTNAEEELTGFNFHILYKIEVNPFFNLNVETMEAIKKNSNIAVLTLETAVPLTSSVRPVCLPSLIGQCWRACPLIDWFHSTDNHLLLRNTICNLTWPGLKIK